MLSMTKLEACHCPHPVVLPPSFSDLCHQTQNTIINIRVNSMAVWLQGNLEGEGVLCWGSNTKSRVTRKESIYRKYQYMASVRNVTV